MTQPERGVGEMDSFYISLDEGASVALRMEGDHLIFIMATSHMAGEWRSEMDLLPQDARALRNWLSENVK